MSNSDRRSYLTATVLNQAFLDACQDNLETRLEMILEIETPTGFIYASDRNKYVGSRFYEALLNFPLIGRTVGEWLSNELQFSTLTLELSNVDGRFNTFLQGGADFDGWVGKSVVVKVGLAEQASTYTTIFRGQVTDVGGFKRSVETVTIIARDDYDRMNVQFPRTVFKHEDFTKIEDKNIGKVIPIIYGDWTTDTDPSPASVPAYVVNGKDALVDFKERLFTVTSPASPAVFSATDHNFDDNDPVQLTTNGSLPTPLLTGVDYYIKASTDDTFQLSLTPGGAAINTLGAQSGQHKVKAAPTATRRNLKFRISENDLESFDSASVYLKRGEVYNLAPQADIVNIGAGNKTFELVQDSGTSWVDNGTALEEYLFDAGDEFLVKVTGKNLGAYDNNIVEQARDVLITYGGLLSGDFDSNWNTYRDKASPSQSAISSFKSRIWLQEPQSALTFALSLLEQVRLEAFVDRNLKFKINSLHFEDWVAAPTFTIKNWDVGEKTFKTSIDDRNNFNRAQGVYNLLPDRNENARATPIFRNSAAISQAGKEISKKVVFPNLYQDTVVQDQLAEILKLASSTLETLEMSLTWRALLKDIGEFVKMDVKIGSSIFDEIPCMIREIGYDPQGLKIPVKLWSFQMVPFPGYSPGYSGIVGGSTATIAAE